MKRIYVLLLVLVALACEEQDNTYQGPALVEFATSFRGSSSLYTVSEPDQEFNDNLEIQLVAPPQDNPINVTWEFDEENSTAIEGVHFDFISDNTVTIEPGSNSVKVEFVVYGEAFEDPEDQRTISLEIVSADVGISENYKKVVQKLAITCPSNLEGTYTAQSTGQYGDGEGGQQGSYQTTTSVVLTEESPGVYFIDDMSFGFYEIAGYDDPIGRIRDVCGNLTDLGDTDQYGDPFTINGEVLEGGVIELTWGNTWGDTGVVTLTPQ